MLEISGLTLAGIVAGYILGAFGAGVWSNWRKDKGVRPKEREVLIQEATTRDSHPEIMVKLLPTVNGRMLEISVKKHNPSHGHWDWEHEMYIVQEGQTLSEAISFVLVMKGMEK